MSAGKFVYFIVDVFRPDVQNGFWLHHRSRARGVNELLKHIFSDMGHTLSLFVAINSCSPHSRPTSRYFRTALLVLNTDLLLKLAPHCKLDGRYARSVQMEWLQLLLATMKTSLSGTLKHWFCSDDSGFTIWVRESPNSLADGASGLSDSSKMHGSFFLFYLANHVKSRSRIKQSLTALKLFYCPAGTVHAH